MVKLGGEIGVTLWLTKAELLAAEDALGSACDLLSTVMGADSERLRPYRSALSKFEKALIEGAGE